MLQEQKETFLSLVDFIKKMNDFSKKIGAGKLGDEDEKMIEKVNEMCLDAKINLNNYKNYETMTTFINTKKVAKTMQNLIHNAMDLIELISLKSFNKLDEIISFKKGEEKECQN